MTRPRRRDESGQATAELALLLPAMLVLVLGVGQVVLVWRAQLLATQAAREAVRIAAVTSDRSAIEAAAVGATTLDGSRLMVEIVERGAPGGLATVRVTYHPVDLLPIVGSVIASVAVDATATMAVEN